MKFVFVSDDEIKEVEEKVESLRKEIELEEQNVMEDSSKKLSLRDFSPIAKLKNDNNISLLKLEEKLEEQLQFLEEDILPLEEEKSDEKKKSKFGNLFLISCSFFEF